ncbi:MAG: hypothetical protein KDD47_22600, partial [Acidobacteria bacterium]|nr:hypothetical protein [Acidobacteriota bacterium]
GLAALLLATLMAMNQLYFGQAFGTVKDYAGAFLWGFGTDFTLRSLQTLIGFSRTLRNRTTK